MLNILLIVAFIFFVVIAPIKIVVTTVISILLVVASVKLCTKAISGHSPSMIESFNAVALSCIFAVIAMFALNNFTGNSTYTGVSALAALVVFFSSYVLGFSTALGTKFLPSIIIAIITTAISQAIFFVVQPTI